jgi:hypothetical protein
MKNPTNKQKSFTKKEISNLDKTLKKAQKIKKIKNVLNFEDLAK